MYKKIKRSKVYLLLPLLAILFTFTFIINNQFVAAQNADVGLGVNPCEKKKGKDKEKCEKEQKEKKKLDGVSGFGTNDGKYQCGNSKDAVKTKIDLGCLGKKAPKSMGPIEDLLYAIVRLLTIGVGIVIIGSIVVSGIQYSTSEGKPDTTQSAKNRIQSAVIGLVIYVFAFALLQYLVPGGVFR